MMEPAMMERCNSAPAVQPAPKPMKEASVGDGHVDTQDMLDLYGLRYPCLKSDLKAQGIMHIIRKDFRTRGNMHRIIIFSIW